MLRLKVPYEFGKVKYRGPDNTHSEDFDEYGWMGFHRLKIIDISDRGNQPLVYKNIHLVCNGEIYNYPELRKKYEHSYPN